MKDLFPFTASNGWQLERHETRAGAIVMRHPEGSDSSVLWPVEVHALREFFQAERDASLGRWRSKDHPGYVVYLSTDKDGDRVVFNERKAEMQLIFSGESDFPTNADEWNAVTAEFHAAHPEPKPWHDAKPGEVWVLKLDTYRETVFRCQDGLAVNTPNGRGFVNVIPDTPPGHLGITAPAITAGRRIFPEGGDES